MYRITLYYQGVPIYGLVSESINNYKIVFTDENFNLIKKESTGLYNFCHDKMDISPEFRLEYIYYDKYYDLTDLFFIDGYKTELFIEEYRDEYSYKLFMIPIGYFICGKCKEKKDICNYYLCKKRNQYILCCCKCSFDFRKNHNIVGIGGSFTIQLDRFLLRKILTKIEKISLCKMMHVGLDNEKALEYLIKKEPYDKYVRLLYHSFFKQKEKFLKMLFTRNNEFENKSLPFDQMIDLIPNICKYWDDFTVLFDGE